MSSSWNASKVYPHLRRDWYLVSSDLIYILAILLNGQRETRYTSGWTYGYAGAYAVEVVQEINGQVCVIDEIYEQGLITKEIIEIAQSRPWWKDVQGGVIDIAGYQHQAMSAPAEIWMEETGLYLSGQKIKINDGTERLKGFFEVRSSN